MNRQGYGARLRPLIMATRDYPASPLLREAIDYWERLRGDRDLPARADLNPVDIPRLLPYVMLIDVLENPRDFRFRLLGTEHDRIVSGDYRGRCFSELPGLARGNPVWDQYVRTVETGAPVIGTVSYIGGDLYIPRELEHCLLPFASNGTTVDVILVVTAIDRLDRDDVGPAEAAPKTRGGILSPSMRRVSGAGAPCARPAVSMT